MHRNSWSNFGCHGCEDQMAQLARDLSASDKQLSAAKRKFENSLAALKLPLNAQGATSCSIASEEMKERLPPGSGDSRGLETVMSSQSFTDTPKSVVGGDGDTQYHSGYKVESLGQSQQSLSEIRCTDSPSRNVPGFQSDDFSWWDFVNKDVYDSDSHDDV
ncbi:hypothetical protein NliqN6_0073 [Naganishia liquefaciens]|uniref:Uncharacterized protein n=1 Tax=Naganishia liquefaciens TaxID=104408 RepID=A0A8H3TM82_9TREE|nr:hypothetical protein NliqN6_0073 [Naganishia liquefaciens]